MWRRAGFGLLLILLVGLAGIGWLAATTPPLPLPDLEASVEILDREGQVLRRFTTAEGFWRLPIELEQVDPGFIEQLVLIEDRRFYQHPGFDPLALARALWQLAREGRVVSGASTLTMQVVRLLQPRPRTWVSKLREIWLALHLERQLSKHEILRLYLNLAPYGGNIQGLGAASMLYFGQSPQRLSPSQRALLLALPQSPERRRPDRQSAAARRARDQILARLYDQGVLDRQTFMLARAQAVPQRRQSTPVLAAHLSERLRRRHRGQRQIPTTLDASLQRRLEDLAQRTQAQLEPGSTLALMVVEHGGGGVLAHLGSSDYFKVGQWDMTEALRSPGSTLKPFIYGLGFELALMHPNTAFIDRPPPSGGYSPVNFDKGYHGRVDVRTALRLSLNTAAVAALDAVGPERLMQRLRAQGVELELPDGQEAGLPVALGGVGMRMRDLVALYAALANGGEYRPLRILRDQQAQRTTRLLSPLAVGYLDEILRQMPVPTGVLSDRAIRYKTGTSYGFRDAWALGYDQGYSVGVWVGRADNGYGKEISGSQIAAPLLFELFRYLPPVRTGVQRHQPEGLMRLAQAQLPQQMRWLGVDQESRDGARPRIRMPADGAQLVRGRAASGNSLPVVLQVQGGMPPYHWLVNGLPLLAEPSSRTQHQWNPQGLGQIELSVVDAQGASDRISLWLE